MAGIQGINYYPKETKKKSGKSKWTISSDFSRTSGSPKRKLKYAVCINAIIIIKLNIHIIQQLMLYFN